MGIQQRVSEITMKKKSVGHSHIFPQLRGIDAAFIDGIEHAGIGEDDDEESHQV